jgi:cobalt-zinc-cadmium efflux system protein
MPSIEYARALRPALWTDLERYLVGMGISACICAMQVVGGLVAGSIALLADSAHVASDAAAYAISLTVTIRARGHADEDALRGRGARWSALVLLVPLGWIAIEAVRRLAGDVEPVHGTALTAFAALGMLGNVLQLWAMHGGTLTITGRMQVLHVLGDLGSSAAVVLGGVMIWLFGASWIDPALSLGLALAIGGLGIRAAFFPGRSAHCH